MNYLSGKPATGPHEKAWALSFAFGPPITRFGFLPDLALATLDKWWGYRKPHPTPAEVDEVVAALLAGDDWNQLGARIVPAEAIVAHEFSWSCELDDVAVYYDGPPADEYAIREAVAASAHDRATLHVMLDMMIEHDRRLTPALVAQIHWQLDE